MSKSQGKLSFAEKLGYSCAASGDAVAYTFISSYLLFFLTTIAGIQPATAGTLTVIGAVWNAVFNPVMGYISDHSNTRFGRRRPYIIGFCIPLAISIVLLFTATDFSGTVKTVYYGLIVIMFWTSYTGFFVPYYALGAEYTSNYEDQTALRSFAAFFNIIGTFFSMGLPSVLVDFCESGGLEERTAWTITALVLSCIEVGSITITFFVSKDKDVYVLSAHEKSEKFSFRKLFSEYIQVIALRPMRWLLLASLFYLIAYAMFTADIIYFLTYNAGFTAGKISLSMMLRSVISIAILWPVALLCSKTDKRSATIIVLLIGCICCTGIRFLPLTGIPQVVILILFSVTVSATYWQVIPALFYDVCEYDECTTGKRREGAILSVQGLVESLAAGFGSQILGICLQFGNFDNNAGTQCPEALDWIFNCSTWVPVIFLALAAFALIKYPITKKYYDEMHIQGDR